MQVGIDNPRTWSVVATITIIGLRIRSNKLLTRDNILKTCSGVRFHLFAFAMQTPPKTGNTDSCGHSPCRLDQCGLKGDNIS